MKRFLAVMLSVSFASHGSAVAFGASPFLDPIFGVKTTRDVLYASGAVSGGSISLYLDIYQPRDIGLGMPPALSPAVVIQHGGAWTSGNKADAQTPATFLASYGFTVLSAQYRLRGDRPRPGPGPWDNLDFPVTVQIFPGVSAIKAGIEDAGAAMAWTRNNAAMWGIDPDSIGLAGGSAGGIDALLFAYNNPAPISTPQAVLGLVASAYDSAGDNSKFHANSPPAFFLNGITDPIVPYDIPLTEAKMDAAGVYYDSNIHDLGFGAHDVEWDYVFQPGESDHHVGFTVLEAMQRFLAVNLADVSLTRGDFDADSDVDGNDFLAWQRGESPGRLSRSELADWEANFGTAVQAPAASTATPEPRSAWILIAGTSLLCSCRGSAGRRPMATGDWRRRD